jgi:DNA repair exonuclease SbcCD nuclease subunit
MMRIVFTADNHLNRYYAKMTPDQLLRRREKLRGAFARTVDFAIEHRCHLYLHAGDMFDTSHPRTSELVWVARQFRRLKDAGVKIFAIGGTHDVPKMRVEGATPQRIFAELDVAHVFTKTTKAEFVVFELERTRVSIGGLAPDPRLERGEDPLEGVDFLQKEADFSFLLVHYGVEGILPYEVEEAVIPRKSIAGLKGIDCLLAGHIHSRRNFQIADVRVLIPGATERLTFGEVDNITGFWYLELEGDHLRTRYINLEPQPMRRLEVRTPELPHDDPTGYLMERIKEVSHPQLLLQLRLEGPLPREVYHRLRFFELWRLGNELNFFFDLDKRVQIEAELPEITGPRVGRISAKEEIGRVASELLREASPEEREIIIEAKRMLLERYSAL